ncbi:MAG: hypothetical protein OEY59_04130, partial [Deltaproteobacteria bacterium]|nr:hypothetical protein [Deltaproteobacteria bacterium]
LRFVDYFPVSESNSLYQPFFENHWKLFNYKPDYTSPTSYTIFAYEAIEILSGLLDEPKNQNRESLRESLQNLKDFQVMTGKVTTLQNRELLKELNILRIKGGHTISVF